MESPGKNSRPVDREIIQISLIRNEKLIRAYESLQFTKSFHDGVTKSL